LYPGQEKVSYVSLENAILPSLFDIILTIHRKDAEDAKQRNRLHILPWLNSLDI
jgi:hypothetical protein